MWCITIEEGYFLKRNLYFKNEGKANIKAKELVEREINLIRQKYFHEITLYDLSITTLSELQSTLNLMIKLQYGMDKYLEHRFHVNVSKIQFQDDWFDREDPKPFFNEDEN